jgi:Probable cobalt transporter subunit (CbtA)
MTAATCWASPATEPAPTMVSRLLVGGMLAGVLAGVLSLGFAELFGEPQVDKAIAVEEQKAAAAGEPAAPELVSRSVQSGPGIGTAVVVYGAALGGLFSIAFAFAHGRLGGLRARASAGLLALGGFVLVVGVPFLKYPANPPAVGDPTTIGRRSTLYFTLVLISVLLGIAAVQAARRLVPRFGGWNGVLLAVAGYIALVTATAYALPGVNEVPADFPAVVLYRFRLASLGTQAVLWSGLGLIFGALAERVLTTTPAPTTSRPATR